MKVRLFLVLAILTLLLPGGPTERAAAVGSAGAVTDITDDACIWHCYGRPYRGGITPFNPPSTTVCLNYCRDQCGGPCDQLY